MGYIFSRLKKIFTVHFKLSNAVFCTYISAFCKLNHMTIIILQTMHLITVPVDSKVEQLIYLFTDVAGTNLRLRRNIVRVICLILKILV